MTIQEVTELAIALLGLYIAYKKTGEIDLVKTQEALGHAVPLGEALYKRLIADGADEEAAAEKAGAAALDFVRSHRMRQGLGLASRLVGRGLSKKAEAKTRSAMQARLEALKHLGPQE